MKHLVIALALCGLVGPVLAEDGKLILPSRSELNTYLKNNPQVGCTHCGIVVSINVYRAQEKLGKPSSAASANPNSVAIQPLPVGGKEARAERKKLRQPPAESYQVTVHNDDGSSSIYEQNEQPDFAKGDRVQLVDGKLQRF